MQILYTTILLVIATHANAQLPEYWYHVTTGVENWWPVENSIFITKTEGTDTIYLSGFTRMDAQVWGILNHNELTIPKQSAIIEPKGGDGQIEYKVFAQANGILTDSTLELQFYFKPDTLAAVTGSIKAIRWSRMDQWRKYPAIDHSNDTIINNVAYYWKKYDLNGRPMEVGETNDNNKKNGRWFFWDQQGKLLNEYRYVNDTLHGTATEYLYSTWHKGRRLLWMYFNSEGETTIRNRGLYLKGHKTGRWLYETRRGKGEWRTEADYDYDTNGSLTAKTLYYPNGKLQMYYDRSGEMVWFCNYDSKGRVVSEGSKMLEASILELQ